MATQEKQVGYSLKRILSAELKVQVLLDTLPNRKAIDLTHHSDQGIKVLLLGICKYFKRG